MPELRKDVLTGRQVLVAEERAQRPNEFAQEGSGTDLAADIGDPASWAPRSDCPFCPGNESETPPAVDEIHDSAGAWQVRAVPNRFPAMLPELLHAAAADDAPPASPLRLAQTTQPAAGVQEVIIESPLHAPHVSDLGADPLATVLTMYQRRLQHWRAAGDWAYGLVFKNVGPLGGASLSHPHSQLVALPEVPPAVTAQARRADEYRSATGRCGWCDVAAREQADGGRTVLQQDGLVAFCPYVSLQPYETWLLPTAHRPRFEDEPAAALAALAAALHALLARIEPLVGRAGYNLLLHTAPWNDSPAAGHHWRIEIFPRLSTIAGLELVTGVHINALPPERAAEKLHTRSGRVS